MNGTAIPHFETVNDLHIYIRNHGFGRCPPAALEMCVLSTTALQHGWVCELIDSDAIFNFPTFRDALESIDFNIRRNYIFRLFILYDNDRRPPTTIPVGSLLFANAVSRMIFFNACSQGVTTTANVDFIQIL